VLRTQSAGTEEDKNLKVIFHEAADASMSASPWPFPR